MPNASEPNQVGLVIFHEITKADELKMKARSNTSKTGGGARDLRFNYDEFDGVFQKIFPTLRQKPVTRKGVYEVKDIFYGVARFEAEGEDPISSELAWYTPTKSRPREGRIPTVHKIPALSVLPRQGLGIPMLLFIQSTSAPLTLAYAYEDQFAEWDARLAEVLRESIDARRGSNAASGYIDLLNDERNHVHGRRH